MRRSPRWHLILMSLLLPCLLLGPRTAPAAPAPGRIALTLRALATAGRVTRSVGQNDVVYSGERLELYVRLDRGAYVSVIVALADGSEDVLFPKQGELFVPADSEVRIPSAGQDIELDDTPGEERLYVIASPQPLAKTDPAFAEAVRQIHKAAAASGGAPKPRPARPGPVAGKLQEKAGVEVRENAPKPAVQAAPTKQPQVVAQTTSASDAYEWKSKGVRLAPNTDSSVNRADAPAGGVAIFALTLQHRGRRLPARP